MGRRASLVHAVSSMDCQTIATGDAIDSIKSKLGRVSEEDERMKKDGN